MLNAKSAGLCGIFGPRKNGDSRELTQFLSDLDCFAQLIVAPKQRFTVGPIHGDIRSDSLAFDAVPVPTHICADWNDDSVVVSDLEARTGQKSAGRFVSNDSAEAIFLGKLSEHFRRARGVFIHKNHHSAVKALPSQAGGFKHN